jgi:DNA-directed RNA polymerase specialized sigma24 family protein
VLDTEQTAALDVARKAQRRFERAQRAVDTATDERAAAVRAALKAGISYGELASAFGWPRSSVQSAERGRESNRKR